MERNYLSPIILSKLPTFISVYYPKFYKLLEHYYTFLEEDGYPLDVLENYLNNQETNNLIVDNIDLTLKDLSFDIKSITTKKDLIINFLRDFYLAKGTAASVNFLFRAVFGTSAKVYYPRNRLFSLSSTRYGNDLFIYTTANSKDTSFNDYFSIISEDSNVIKQITGNSSFATTLIQNVEQYYASGDYLKIICNEHNNLFYNNEGVVINGFNTKNNITTEIKEFLLPIINVNVEDSGKGYDIGDEIIINDCLITGKYYVKDIECGVIHKITVINPGSKYKVGDEIVAKSIVGNSFSAYVSKVTDDNYISIDYDSNLTCDDDTTLQFFVNVDKFKNSTLFSQRDAATGWEISIDLNGRLVFSYINKFVCYSTRSLLLNTWNFVAVVVNTVKNNISFFINEIPAGVFYFSDSEKGISSNANFIIGNNLYNYGFVGYLDNIRFTKAIIPNAQITPIAPFSSQDIYHPYVSLLLNFDDMTDSSIWNRSITVNGDVEISSKKKCLETTSCYFKDEGAIEQVTIINSGYNYKYIPTLFIKTVDGSGAVLSIDDTYFGRIKNVDMIEPYINTDTDVTFNIITKNGSGAALTATLTPYFRNKSKFKNNNGMLGINSVITDSNYYQYFSYQIASSISNDRYDDIANEYIHPSGFIRHSLLLLLDIINISDVLFECFIVKYKPISNVCNDIMDNNSFINILKHLTTCNFTKIFNTLLLINIIKFYDNFNTFNSEFSNYDETLMDNDTLLNEFALDSIITIT